MSERRSTYRAKRPAKRKPDKSQSEYEAALVFQIRVAGLEPPTQQYRWHPLRNWTTDIAYPEHKLLFEVQGGVYMVGKGSHTYGDGYINDCRKLNEAQLLGYQMYYLPAPWVDTGEALRYVETALGRKSDWTPPGLADDGFPY